MHFNPSGESLSKHNVQKHSQDNPNNPMNKQPAAYHKIDQMVAGTTFKSFPHTKVIILLHSFINFYCSKKKTIQLFTK